MARYFDEKRGLSPVYRERQVREEYAWVPDFLFRRERKAILKEFLARAQIFSSTHFRDRYEQQARSNIERSLKRLEA